MMLCTLSVSSSKSVNMDLWTGQSGYDHVSIKEELKELPNNMDSR